MAQKCTLCSLDFKNSEQFKQHLDGKKHKKIESIKLEREKNAERSLFVSNLKKDTFIKHLEEHFSQFGKINKIVMDQEKNAYAIIEYESKECVEKALSIEHKVNEKNLKVSRRQLKEFVSKHMSNSDKKKEALEKLKEEALVVNKQLDKCESFDEQVEKLIEHLKISDEHLETRKSICEDLNKIFRNFWNENVKVSIFGSTHNGLATNGSDMDMTLLLNDYFPDNRSKQQKQPQIKIKQVKSQLQQQDSSDSNMAESVDTELDEEIDLDANHEIDMSNDQGLKNAIAKFFNEKCYNEFLNFELEHQVKLVAKIIQRHYLEIKSLRTITNTRCPVVRFSHEKANIFCDLSLNNYLACENTKLIELYMNLEPNLKRLIFVIRYWMKQKNLYASSRFNSYTIIWLIIFYLQKNNIGYLPTVRTLSSMTDHVYEIHGWNCAFETNIEKIKSLKPQSNESDQTTEHKIDINNFNDLLKGFFEFYSSFQFCLPNTNDSIVISTRNAEVINHGEKTDLSKLSFLNIEDPFDQSHNLSANVSKNTLERFICECKNSNEILQHSKSPRKTSNNKCWGLMLLMTRKSLPLLSSSKTALASKDLVEKSLLKLKLNDDPTNNIQQKENYNDFTVKKSIEFVLFLFKDCLMFEELKDEQFIEKKRKRIKNLNLICDQVDLLGLNCSPKRFKIANNSDPSNSSNTYVCVIDENLNNNQASEEDEAEKNLIASYNIWIKHNTWQGRRVVKRDLKQKFQNLNDFELEKMTSQKLIEANRENEAKNNLNFCISFSLDSSLKQEGITKDEDISSLNIKFDLLENSSNQKDLISFSTLVHFLDIYINNCHEKMFTEWNKVQQVKI